MGTISEDAVFGQQSDPAPHPAQAGCPSCGYPVRPGAAVCPNCGKTLSGGDGFRPGRMTPPPFPERESSAEGPKKQPVNVRQEVKAVKKCQKCGAQMAADAKFCPTCGAPTRMGTINPWTTPQSGAFCTLRPIAWEGEGVEHKPLTFSGTSVSLNRANTDPENQTITSKEQAILTREEGAWYVEDTSEQKTTYLHVGRKTKLSDGDIIILGNRMFEFKG